VSFANVKRDLRRRRYWVRLAGHAFAALGALAVAVELYDVFAPGALSKSKVPWFPILAAISATYGVVRAWPRPVQQTYSRPQTTIRIVEGDLLAQDVNKVIGMSTTFDTATPNVIAQTSLQAQYMEAVYGGDRDALDADLAAALSGHGVLKQITKDGKTDVYPMGTVAVLRRGRHLDYCLAYTDMDERNVAGTTVANVWLSLDRLWAEVGATANGDPVAMPVIGGGLSRISQVLPAQDAIRLTAMSFMFASRDQRVCERLDIVVMPNQVPRLDMLELQDFLASLDESS